MVFPDYALVAVHRDGEAGVSEVVHRLAHGPALEDEHGGVRGTQRVEGDVGSSDLFTGHAECSFDGRGREQPVVQHGRVEQHGVGFAVLAEPADMVLDEWGERFRDGYDPFAAFGLGLAQPVFAPVVGAAVDGVSDVELQVLKVDVPELQCAYLADAQSAYQEGEPEHEPLVVGEERGQPVDLVGGDRRLVTSFGLRFDDAVPARARGDERRGAVRLLGLVAASMTRLSIRAACSNVHAVSSSLAFTYHSSTIWRVMRSSGVSPNASLSRRSTISLHRLDRPDSLLPSGLRYPSK